MADIGTSVSLLVATVELAQVKSVRSATRANLVAAGGVEGPLGNIEMPKPVGSTRTVTPEPRIEPRRVIHPEPVYAPRMVIEPEPTIEPAPVVEAVNSASTGADAPRSPLVPPWRMALPVDGSIELHVVKCPPPPPDLINKGSLIDFFI